MGVIQSKKQGITKKYELKIDLKALIKSQLLDLTNWSLPDIKQLYDIYSRSNDCPFIDFFTFHKLMPFTTQVSRYVFDSYALGEKYANIFQIVSTLILISHNNYRKKLQMLFVLFDFNHLERLTNRELILIFESIVNGFCRVTGQACIKYEYLAKYSIQRFIRVNTLEALQKIVTYRRLIEEVEGNNDAFQLFKRFDQQIYGYFTQESFLFRVRQYKKYTRQDVEKIYRIIKKVNLDKNYEEVELVDKNRRFRLQNRKIQCIKHLLQEKQEKFKHTIGSFKSKSTTGITKSTMLPTVKRQSDSLFKGSPKINAITAISKLSNPQSNNREKNKVLLLNGKLQSKEDIFQTIKYFKNLSGNKSQIKIKQFLQSFDKKSFLKKQISSLFKHFDLNKKGQIDFQTFLRAYYHNITQDQIDLIKQWYRQYKKLHEADHFDLGLDKKKEKKNNVELPKDTLKRIDQIFNSIDRQKKGYLSIQDLKKAYNTGFTIKQLQDIMKQFGKNNKLYKEEFIRMTLPEDWSIEGTQYVGV